MSWRVQRDLALVTLIALVGLAIYPQNRAPIATGWTLIVLAYTLFWLNSSVGAAATRPSRFEAALRVRPPRSTRPDDLERCERALGLKVYGAADLDHHVRPLLRELVTHKLKERHGVDLAADAEPALPILDPELQALVGRTPAETLYDRRLATADIARLVAKIEVL